MFYGFLLVFIGKPLTKTFPLDSSTAFYRLSDIFCTLQFVSINMAAFPEYFRLLRLDILEEVYFNNFMVKCHRTLARRCIIAYINKMSWHCVLLWQREVDTRASIAVISDTSGLDRRMGSESPRISGTTVTTRCLKTLSTNKIHTIYVLLTFVSAGGRLEAFLTHFSYFEKIKWGLWDNLYCLCVRVPSNIARQRLGKHIPAGTSIHAAIELFDPVFSMQSVTYQIIYNRRLVLPRTSCYVFLQFID
jgi:hypothetical protein